jgi:hypothetical protein
MVKEKAMVSNATGLTASVAAGVAGSFVSSMDGRPMLLLLKIGHFFLPMIVSFNVYNHQKKIAVAS